MSKWIPVSTRLPETEQKMFAWATVEDEELWSCSEAVLVHHHDKTFPTPYCIAELTQLAGEEPKWNEVETGDVINDVIAWMHIPSYEREEYETID